MYKRQVQSNLFNSGLKGFSRLKRTTLKTFKDLRFYIHNYNKETEIRTRYKSSRRLMKYDDIYFFSTIVYEKNTVASGNLRYLYNQGVGHFITDKNNYNLTYELGLAYDNSDYLNSQIRTSFLKNSISLDVFFWLLFFCFLDSVVFFIDFHLFSTLSLFIFDLYLFIFDVFSFFLMY